MRRLIAVTVVVARAVGVAMGMGVGPVAVRCVGVRVPLVVAAPPIVGVPVHPHHARMALSGRGGRSRAVWRPRVELHPHEEGAGRTTVRDARPPLWVRPRAGKGTTK